VIRVLLGLAVVAALAVGGGLYIAENASGPEIEIARPTRLVGRAATFEAAVTAPGGNLTSLDAVIEQNGRSLPLYSLDTPLEGEIRQDGPDRIRVTRRFDRTSHPDLTGGAAQVIVSAARPVLFGLREASSTTHIDVEVRLEPPRIQVVSTFHYINHGGSEMVVYRVTPPDAESGVRVGDRLYRGYPASGAGVDGDDALRVAFFALLHDQDLGTPVELYATDEAGNDATAAFDHRMFPKTFRRSQIPLSDGFLRAVVPPIVGRAPELADEEVDSSTSVEELADLYLFINRTLREQNRSTIAAFAGGTSSHLQWDGPFVQLSNSQVESGFADHRTYVYAGNDIDQQVHLGFDLASTANAPVAAANGGTVVHADYLGIYGNCVILDHGMGLQTLYAHLAAIDVTPGQQVTRAQQIGLSGRTGLAGGDHLHFAVLLQGHPVTPVEWWDPHWIEDRIERKLNEANGIPAP
jgi:murein DD-endopeptidase MepM/ murein hydrolase activator NlpD